MAAYYKHREVDYGGRDRGLSYKEEFQSIGSRREVYVHTHYAHYARTVEETGISNKVDNMARENFVGIIEKLKGMIAFLKISEKELFKFFGVGSKQEYKDIFINHSKSSGLWETSNLVHRTKEIDKELRTKLLQQAKAGDKGVPPGWLFSKINDNLQEMYDKIVKDGIGAIFKNKDGIDRMKIGVEKLDALKKAPTSGNSYKEYARQLGLMMEIALASATVSMVREINKYKGISLENIVIGAGKGNKHLPSDIAINIPNFDYAIGTSMKTGLTRDKKTAHKGNVYSVDTKNRFKMTDVRTNMKSRLELFMRGVSRELSLHQLMYYMANEAAFSESGKQTETSAIYRVIWNTALYKDMSKIMFGREFVSGGAKTLTVFHYLSNDIHFTSDLLQGMIELIEKAMKDPRKLSTIENEHFRNVAYSQVGKYNTVKLTEIPKMAKAGTKISYESILNNPEIRAALESVLNRLMDVPIEVGFSIRPETFIKQ